MSTEFDIFYKFIKTYTNWSDEQFAFKLGITHKNFNQKWKKKGFPTRGTHNAKHIVQRCFSIKIDDEEYDPDFTTDLEFETDLSDFDDLSLPQKFFPKRALNFIKFLSESGYDLPEQYSTKSDLSSPETFIDFFRNFICGNYSPKTESSSSNSEKFNSEDQITIRSTIVELDKDDVFIGRDTLINNIHSAFETHPTIFLYGIGGIGKSELAKQYYHKYKSYYNKVIFARYNREKTFATLLANDQIFKIQGISRRIKNVNGNEETQSDDEYALEKINALKKICDNKTLIIIDNFDTDIANEPLFSVFTNNITYRVLVTTRNSQSDYKTIPVSELDDNSLKTLFLKYYGDKSGHIDSNDPVFDELFTWTDRHTLTIELIAKYMKNSVRVTSLRSMLDLLNTIHLNVFSDSSNRGEAQKSYDRIIDILRISDLSDDDKYFLRCLSLTPAAGIKYLDFFEKWILRENDTPRDSDDILYKLSELSFVKQNKREGIIYLHPIIREIVIKELQPSYEYCKNFVNNCVMLEKDFTSLMWGLSYEEKAIYLDCYMSMLNIISAITSDTYPLYVNISLMYNFAGNYSEAIALHKRIYDFARSQFGENSSEAMLILNRIGWKNSNCMLYSQALQYCKTAADYFLSNPCYTTREALSAIQNCGNIYYYLYKQTHDPDDLNNAYNYINKCNQYGEAMLKSTIHSSEHFKIHLKYHHDCLSRDYFKLSLEGQQHDKYDIARKYLEKYEKAIIDFNKVSTIPSADMAGYYKHVANLEYELGHYSEALKALEESYRLHLHYFADQNPRIISVLEELIQCCIKLEDYPKVNEYLTLAIKNASAVFTEDHPTLIRLLDLRQTLPHDIEIA